MAEHPKRVSKIFPGVSRELAASGEPGRPDALLGHAGEWPIPLARALGLEGGSKEGGLTPSFFSAEAIGAGLLEAALRASEAERGALLLKGRGGDVLITGSAGGAKKAMVLAPDGEQRAGVSAGEPGPHILIAPATVPRWVGMPEQVKNAISIPLSLAGEDLGVLWLSNKKGTTPFGPPDVERMLALAAPSAAALTLASRWSDAQQSALVAQRQRLAQEIHDGPIQELSGLVLQLEISEKVATQEPGKLREHLAKVKQEARASLQRLRRLIFDLRAADVEEIELVQLLERAISTFEEKTHIQATLKIGGPRVDLSGEQKSNLLAIVQEALNNVSKHAQARRVEVHLASTSRQLRITIADEGRGFSVEEASRVAWAEKKFGLIGMSERAHLLGGTLRLQSGSQQGTVVTVTLPV